MNIFATDRRRILFVRYCRFVVWDYLGITIFNLRFR